MELRLERQQHLQLLTSERLSYSGRMLNVVQFPLRYISLTIDAMDRTLLPYHVPCIKNHIRKVKRYSLGVFGMMDHGRQNKVYHYPAHAYSKAPNLVLSILFDHLQQ